MKAFSLKAVAILATVIATVFVAGCSGAPQDGRYQNTGRGGGWENFRAEVPPLAYVT
jgi:hypothetical protein